MGLEDWKNVVTIAVNLALLGVVVWFVRDATARARRAEERDMPYREPWQGDDD